MAVRPGSASIFDEARHTATYPYLMASAGAGAANENTTDNPSSRAGGGKVEFFTPSTSRAHSRRSTGQFSLGQPPPISHLAPSMTSIFPTFSYPDVNFWIWCFGWRYRDLVRRWSEKGIGPDVGPNSSGSGSGSASGISTPGGGRDRLADRQVNWAGMALGQFVSFPFYITPSLCGAEGWVAEIIGRFARRLFLLFLSTLPSDGLWWSRSSSGRLWLWED